MPAAEAEGAVGRLGRTFACALCQREVLLCSGCDCGQRYCGVGCREQARGQCLRAAGRRYQDSRAGRFVEWASVNSQLAQVAAKSLTSSRARSPDPQGRNGRIG